MGWLARTAAVMLALAVVIAVALVLATLYDEELTPEAKILLESSARVPDAGSDPLREFAAADDDTLLERYRRLQEATELGDAGANMRAVAGDEPYRRVLRAQTAYLKQVNVNANRRDIDQAMSLLEHDAAFHRRWLAQSDDVFAKFVAARALFRDLSVASQLVRYLDGFSDSQYESLARITAPLSDAERGMGKALRREAAGRLAILRETPPLFLAKNATLNFVAPVVSSWQALDRVDSTKLAAELQRVGIENQERLKPGIRWAYNPAGHALAAERMEIDVAPYFLGLRDLDAYARAVCAQARMRHVEDAHIFDPPCNDPYTGAAFHWDGDARVIWFQSRDRGVLEGSLRDENGRVGIPVEIAASR